MRYAGGIRYVFARFGRGRWCSADFGVQIYRFAQLGPWRFRWNGISSLWIGERSRWKGGSSLWMGAWSRWNGEGKAVGWRAGWRCVLPCRVSYRWCAARWHRVCGRVHQRGRQRPPRCIIYIHYLIPVYKLYRIKMLSQLCFSKICNKINNSGNMIQLKTNNAIINHFLHLRMDKGSFPHFLRKIS